MAEKKYRVIQNEGKISWRVEELWDGGETRTPFGSRDAAIAAEEKIAREKGYINDLVPEILGEEKTLPTDAFTKDPEGAWVCQIGCSVDIDKKEVVFTQGMKFKKGDRYLGLDVTDWLDKNVKAG